jgi:hypothetical protein
MTKTIVSCVFYYLYLFNRRDFKNLLDRQLETSWYVNTFGLKDSELAKDLRNEAFAHAYDLVR